jgi:succinate dehydrogenase hydrophobic anchor subunit
MSLLMSSAKKHRAFSSSSSNTSSSSLLAGDTGTKATHLHHKLTTALVFATPLYLLAPLSDTSIINKVFGLGIASVTAGHSWIGLNYVATDYIPKVSKALVGPARLVNATLAVVTFVGLSCIACNNAGGLRGTVLGLWRGTRKLPEADDVVESSPPLPMRGLANPDSLGRA